VRRRLMRDRGHDDGQNGPDGRLTVDGITWSRMRRTPRSPPRVSNDRRAGHVPKDKVLTVKPAATEWSGLAVRVRASSATRLISAATRAASNVDLTHWGTIRAVVGRGRDPMFTAPIG